MGLGVMSHADMDAHGCLTGIGHCNIQASELLHRGGDGQVHVGPDTDVTFARCHLIPQGPQGPGRLLGALHVHVGDDHLVQARVCQCVSVCACVRVCLCMSAAR